MVKRLRPEYFPYFYYSIMNKLKRTTSSLAKEKSSSRENPTIKALKDNAGELGIKVEELVDGAYEFKLGDMTRRIKRGPIFDVDNAFTYWLCGNKYATYEILSKYGFQHMPHYKRYSFDTIKEARNDFLDRKKAVVIKPCFGTSGGQGVTVDIRSMKRLNRAIYNSLIYDSNYLMEDYIEGDNFRILLFKDKMLDAYQRIPALVKGDGMNNIKNLIRVENERRVKDTSNYPLLPIVIDNDVKQTLINNNISFNYVPKKDEVVHVKTAVNHHAGGETKEIKNFVHNDIIRDCRSIMKIMDITLGGIDIITKNIDKPFSETGGVINEVNTGPGLGGYDKHLIQDILNLMFDTK
jgi:cyanophycin synthetase